MTCDHHRSDIAFAEKMLMLGDMEKLRPRRRWMMIAALVALVVGAFGFWYTRDTYHLRSAASWVREYGAGPGDYHPSPVADEALRQLGPAAVPKVLKLLHSTNSLFETQFARKSKPANGKPPGGPVYWTPQEAPGWFATNLNRFTPWHLTRGRIPPSWQHWQAFVAFRKLGPAGRAAIPDLAELARDPKISDQNIFVSPPYPDSMERVRDLKLAAEKAAGSPNFKGDQPLKPVSIFFSGIPRTDFLTDGEIAACSLAAIGEEAVPALIQLLASDNSMLKRRALVALQLAGPAAEAAVPQLIPYLHSPNRFLRTYATSALGAIGRQPALVVPELIQALSNDPADDFAFFAIPALGQFGRDASNAIPMIMPFTNRLEVVSALALTRIAPDLATRDILPAMVLNLVGADQKKRQFAVEYYGMLTDRLDLAVPALLTATSNRDGTIQTLAVRFLGDFGPAARAAIPRLMSLTTSNNSLSYEAVGALDRIDSDWETRR